MVEPRRVMLAASAAQAAARGGGYGPDSGDVVALARSAMTLSPESAARVGAWLLRAALEADPAALSNDDVAEDVVTIGRVILGIGSA